MSIDKLSDAEVREKVAKFPEWRVAGDKLRRDFQFADFVEAFGFMTRVAILAEASQHHPEWSNVYSRVTVELTTHDAGGISERDFALAESIDGLVSDP